MNTRIYSAQDFLHTLNCMTDDDERLFFLYTHLDHLAELDVDHQLHWNYRDYPWCRSLCIQVLDKFSRPLFDGDTRKYIAAVIMRNIIDDDSLPFVVSHLNEHRTLFRSTQIHFAQHGRTQHEFNTMQEHFKGLQKQFGVNLPELILTSGKVERKKIEIKFEPPFKKQCIFKFWGRKAEAESRERYQRFMRLKQEEARQMHLNGDDFLHLAQNMNLGCPGGI